MSHRPRSRYLRQTGQFCPPEAPPRPGIILLAPSMPRLDRAKLLSTLEGDHGLRDIPVVVVTASDEESDAGARFAQGLEDTSSNR